MISTMVPFSGLNNVMDALFSASGYSAEPADEVFRSPRTDIFEGDKNYLIRMDLPGVGREDLSIDLEDGTLKVEAKREIETPENHRTLRAEIPHRTVYRRSFALGRAVDRDSITARIEDGVLSIELAKSEQSLPRRIEIK